MNDVPRPGFVETFELLVGLNAVILAVTSEQPRVLTVVPQEADPGDARADPPEPLRSLPFGSFDVESDRTLELCMRRSVPVSYTHLRAHET